MIGSGAPVGAASLVLPRGSGVATVPSSPVAQAPAPVATPAPVAPVPVAASPTLQQLSAEAVSVLQAFFGFLRRLWDSLSAPSTSTPQPALPSPVQAAPSPSLPTTLPAPSTPPTGTVQAPATPSAPTTGTVQSAPAPAGGGTLAQALATRSAGQPLTLGAGTFSFDNFGSNPAHSTDGRFDQQGADIPASIPGIAGAGIDRTVIRMTPHTSTHAGDIPATPMTTNQYSLMRVWGSPNLHDFTLQATDQGHLYNGLRLHMVTNARVTNVKVTGVPGSASSPPGETFGINDYRSTGSVYKNIEVDGSGLGASGFGANDSSNLTITNGNFHDNRYGIGATFWQSKDITLVDCTSTNNHGGFNFERVSGTVNLIRPRISGITSGHDISIGTDNTQAVYNIIDPVLAPGQKLRILVGKNYLGKPSPQQRSDVHVYVNGVDRANELVQWV